MKILNPKQIERFLNILDKKYAQQMIHFTESSHLLTKKLQHFCQKNNLHYTLYCTKDVFYDKSKTKYANHSHMHIAKFEIHTSDYKLEETKYDYLIVTLNVTGEDKHYFLDKIYPAMQKEGRIIIISAQSDPTELVQWQSILNEKPYLTVHTFNTMLDNYDVIIIKAK